MHFNWTLVEMELLMNEMEFLVSEMELEMDWNF